jgi:hypothetical protein
MAYVDPNNPNGQPPQPMFGNVGALGQGMFGGLRRGFHAGGQALHPYSNRLMLTGMGLLSGRDGMANAMKGMIAGSALDTEDADRTKLNKALQELQNDPNSSLFAGMSQPEIDVISSDPDTFKQFVANRTKPTDYGEKYQGYLSAKAEGYTGDWMQYQADTKAAGVTIQTGQIPAEMGSRIGLGNQFLYELNVEGLDGKPALRERIKNTFGGDTAAQAKARAELAAGMGDPADIWRRVESGKEALVRNLTGAGMSMTEAQAQAARYSIGATDSATTMLQKMDGLEADLKATRQGAIDARSGAMSKGDGEGDNAGGGHLTRNEDGTLTWSP